MTAIKPEWLAHQQRRFMRPDAQRFVREDAARFFRPGFCRINAVDPVERKYSPDQPRVPAGQPNGGQWTDGEGGDGNLPIELPPIEVIADVIDGDVDEYGFFILAGDVPSGDTPPEFPQRRPNSTREFNALARSAARRIGILEVILELAPYLSERRAEIQASFDPPKSLDELQDAVTRPEKGYDIHHIVERGSRNPDGSEDSLIEAPENLVRIPRWKHWDLNSWYEKSNKRFGDQTPRQYLKDKSWEERRRIGLDGLREVGILK